MSESLRQWRQAYYLSYKNMLQRYPWQWFCTLTFDSDYSTYVADNILLDWMRNLQISEHLQIASFYLIATHKGHSHIHLLALGRGSQSPEPISLHDIDCRKWAREWPFFAKVEVVVNIGLVTSYIALHTFRFKCDDFEIHYYNRNLLRRYRNSLS